MKTLFFIAIGFIALTTVGCRQQDEVYSSEDVQNLRVLKKSRQAAQADSTANSYGNFQGEAVDGDPAPPPRK